MADIACPAQDPVIAFRKAAILMIGRILGQLSIYSMRNSLASLLILVAAAGAVSAKDVANACLSSQRGAGQQTLCRCIQKAADQTLTRRDQKRAAGFFADPDLAQTVRRSDSRRDEDFWDRYEKFGNVARKYCSNR